MRINLAYGALIGILAASFGVLGPMPAQASAVAGTSVPAASHHLASTDRMLSRSDGCGGWGNGWWGNGWGDRCDFGFGHDGFGFGHDGFGFGHDGFGFGHDGFGFGHDGFGFGHGGFDHGGFDHGGGFRR